MRRTIGLILVVLAFAAFFGWWYFPQLEAAFAKSPTVSIAACRVDRSHKPWRSYDKAQFASSYEASFKARKRALDCFASALGLPKGSAEALSSATGHHGTVTGVTRGESVLALAMPANAQGTIIVRKDVHVSFDSPLVGKSIAHAEQWTVTVGKKRIVIARVYECRCDAGAWVVLSVETVCPPKPKPVHRARVAPRMTRAPERCVEVTTATKEGGRLIVSVMGSSLPPSACNAYRIGNGPWQSWVGVCTACEAGLPTNGEDVTMRFSENVWSAMLRICLEDATKHRTCGVYLDPGNDGAWYHWNGRHALRVPRAAWRVDNGNCPSL